MSSRDASEVCENHHSRTKTHDMYDGTGRHRFCCECHINSGGAPADWHPDCMRIYSARKALTTSKEIGLQIAIEPFWIPVADFRYHVDQRYGVTVLQQRWQDAHSPKKQWRPIPLHTGPTDGEEVFE